MGVRLQVVPCGSNAVPCLRKVTHGGRDCPRDAAMRTPAELCSGSEHICSLQHSYLGNLRPCSGGSSAGCSALVEWLHARCRMPLMDTQVWVRAPTRTHQPWVRCLTCTCQRDRHRWYHSRPFVAMACMLYLAGSPAGYTVRAHRGHAYERHPWRKGWPIACHVVAEVRNSQFST